MIHPCDKLCGNKTASGYCATTACINPQYSNIGTVQYGQGVQKRIITNADCFRFMTDDELAEKIGESIDCEVCKTMHHSESGECPCRPHQSCVDFWLDWLKEEAMTNG